VRRSPKWSNGWRPKSRRMANRRRLPPRRPRGLRHGGACLRRALFATRSASHEPATPPRSWPAGSDVAGCDRTARWPAASHAMGPPAGEHRSTRASRAVTRHAGATGGLVRNTAPRRRAPRWPKLFATTQKPINGSRHLLSPSCAWHDGNLPDDLSAVNSQTCPAHLPSSSVCSHSSSSCMNEGLGRTAGRCDLRNSSARSRDHPSVCMR